MSFDLRDVVLVAISVFISLIFLVGNNWLWSINQPRYAVIDVQGLLTNRQKEIGDLVMKKGSTEDDRVKALELAQRFGKDLDAMLQNITKECGCILLNKSALLVPEGLKDYTEEVRKRLDKK